MNRILSSYIHNIKTAIKYEYNYPLSMEPGPLVHAHIKQEQGRPHLVRFRYNKV